LKNFEFDENFVVIFFNISTLSLKELSISQPAKCCPL
jgi:hypothetical protein